MSKTDWNLSEIYESKNCTQFGDDKDLLLVLTKEFEKYKNSLSYDNILESINEYENILKLIEKISSYSFLYLQTKINDEDAQEFYQFNAEFINRIISRIVFYNTEIIKLDKDKLIELCGKYKSFIESCFRYKDHTLSAEAEEVLAKKQMTSRDSWIRLYDEILAGVEVEMDGNKKTLSEVLEVANHSDSEKEREIASKEAGKSLKEVSFYIKHIYNNVALDCFINKDIRKYEKAESFRHLDNNIDEKSVEYLTNAVISGYKNISHRYYKLKASLLSKKNLEYWDRNASIKKSSILDRRFDYESGCRLVLDTFNSFSPLFRDIANDFIEKSWIDVYPKKGKASGAFAHHCSCELHPYILLNYFDGFRDVSTLAHELGHGIHQTLAAKNGPILSETPLTLSEVASLFSEKLLFERFFTEAKTDLEKIDLLCMRLDETMNTVVRQISFFEFEKSIHKTREISELSIESISSIWIEKQKECLGEGVNIDECIKYYWCYISHFFHAPFYVYAYSFAEIFVNSLYNVYKSGDLPNFEERYIEMLSKGGIDRYDVAASKFSLNPMEEKFWIDGVESISRQVDQLEKICNASSLCN